MVQDVPMDSLSDTDRSLVMRVRSGDEEAAGALYERYARRVLGLVRSKFGAKLASTTEPEDIVQSVFKSMFRGIGSGNYHAPPGATLWNLIAVIAVNKLKSKAIHHGALRRDAGRSVSLAPEAAEFIPAIDQNAVEFIELCIKESLEVFSVRDREIIALRIQGNSVDEIRDQTGRSRRTIERSLQRSREQLAELLLSDTDE